MSRLSGVTCCFPVLWIFGAEGQDATSWTLVMEWIYLLDLAQEGASI
jgi:hypothetical protein